MMLTCVVHVYLGFLNIWCFVDKWSMSLFGVLYLATYLGVAFFVLHICPDI